MTKIKVESKYGKPQSRQGGVDLQSAFVLMQDGGAAQAYSGGQLNFVSLANHVSSTSSSGRRTSAPRATLTSVVTIKATTMRTVVVQGTREDGL